MKAVKKDRKIDVVRLEAEYFFIIYKVYVIDWVEWHFNSSRVILCREITKFHSLYVHTDVCAVPF